MCGDGVHEMSDWDMSPLQFLTEALTMSAVEPMTYAVGDERSMISATFATDTAARAFAETLNFDDPVLWAGWEWDDADYTLALPIQRLLHGAWQDLDMATATDIRAAYAWFNS